MEVTGDNNELSLICMFTGVHHLFCFVRICSFTLIPFSGVPQEGVPAVLHGAHWLLLSHWRHLHWITRLLHPHDVPNAEQPALTPQSGSQIYCCQSTCMVDFFSWLYPVMQRAFPSSVDGWDHMRRLKQWEQMWHKWTQTLTQVSNINVIWRLKMWM